MIEVQNLEKTYPDATRHVRAVDGVSFVVQEGAFYTLLGPSGCGKTTSLRCVAGLERPDGGRVTIGDTVVVSDNVFVPPQQRDIGMVFQSYAIWPHMSAFDNVAFPLRVGGAKIRKAALRERVEHALERVDLAGFGARLPGQLSGGQQQRLALARALVRQPKVLLLDEPLSNLDARLRGRMRTELAEIQKSLGITTLFVTHDQAEALTMSDVIAVMHDGRIVQEGTPEAIYYDPQDEFVASFVGSTNIFAGTVSRSQAESSAVVVSAAFGTVECTTRHVVNQGDAVTVAVRPDDLRLHHPESHRFEDTVKNVIRGKVERSTFAGPTVEYKLSLTDGTQLQARSSSRGSFAEGDVLIEFPSEYCRILPAAARSAAAGEAAAEHTALA